MAFRMQTSVPDVMDLSKEPESIFKLYGDDSNIAGSFAANCFLARRLIEKDVRFVQLYHQGWDHHGDLPRNIKIQCKETDQPTAGLIKDLKQRGLLEDTLVIWGGEFGRTNYSQGELQKLTMPETITLGALRYLWLEQVLKRVFLMDKLMNLDIILLRIQFMFMIFRLH